MIKFNSFTKAPPVTPEQLKLSDMGVQFIVDDTGRCWYDITKELEKDYAGQYIVEVDENRRVKGWSKDPSSMFPVGSTIVVASKLPAGLLSNLGVWKYDATTDTISPDFTANVTAVQRRKDNELTAASNEISTLKDAVEDGVATDAEIERLALLKTYRIAINRIDVDNPEWPTKP